MTASDIIEACILQPAREQRERERELAAQVLAAGTLARFTAERTKGSVSYDEAWTALREMPDNLLPLLNSVEGWSVIDSLICAAVGERPLIAHPTQH